MINEQKAKAIIAHITYDKLTSVFGPETFTKSNLKKGCLGVNPMAATRNFYAAQRTLPPSVPFRIERDMDMPHDILSARKQNE